MSEDLMNTSRTKDVKTAKMKCQEHKYVEHVEEDVEFDDGLSADDVVHHRHVDVVHHDAADDQNDAFQQITNLSRIQQISRRRPATTQLLFNRPSSVTTPVSRYQTLRNTDPKYHLHCSQIPHKHSQPSPEDSYYIFGV